MASAMTTFPFGARRDRTLSFQPFLNRHVPSLFQRFPFLRWLTRTLSSTFPALFFTTNFALRDRLVPTVNQLLLAGFTM